MSAIFATNPYGIKLLHGWKESTLGELVDNADSFIQTGPFGSQLHAHDYKSEGVPVVMPQQLSDNRIELDGIARISEEDRDRLSRHIMEEGDIVFSRRGDVTRRAIITSQEAGYLCGTGCLLIRLKHPQIDNRFLSLFFSLPQFKDYIVQRAVGATMPNLNTGILERIPLVLPIIKTQRRIVDILSAYDDLIENNRRRMALLEESARLLYQEWFVRLRFPGHEHVRIVNGLPEGWERCELEQCLMLQRGFDLPVQNRRDGLVPIYGSTGIVGLHTNAKVAGPGLVTGRSGSLGEVSYIAVDFWPLNTSLWVKEFRKVSPLFALYLLRYMDLKQYNGGASVPTLDRKAVHRVDVTVPSRKWVSAFDEFASPLFRQIGNFELQNQKLRAARDLLLPRLMSGEVVV